MFTVHNVLQLHTHSPCLLYTTYYNYTHIAHVYSTQCITARAHVPGRSIQFTKCNISNSSIFNSNALTCTHIEPIFKVNYPVSSMETVHPSRWLTGGTVCRHSTCIRSIWQRVTLKLNIPNVQYGCQELKNGADFIRQKPNHFHCFLQREKQDDVFY